MAAKHEDEAEMITRLEQYVTEATRRCVDWEGEDFSATIMDLLLEWFWYEDRRAAKAQLRAARKLGVKVERYGQRIKRKPCDPLDEIRPSMDRWLREGARDRGYCKSRLRS